MANVVCPSCHGIYHETTDAFDKSKRLNGSMFHAKQIVKTMRWYSFAEKVTTGPGDLVCPQCGAPYIDAAAKFCCQLVGAIPVSKPKAEPEREEKPLPIAMTDTERDQTIEQMAGAGKTMTEIGVVVGMSRQAVTGRLKALNQ
jgi:uncharacterized Zn finger protein (UPF0148 family)